MANIYWAKITSRELGIKSTTKSTEYMEKWFARWNLRMLTVLRMLREMFLSLKMERKNYWSRSIGFKGALSGLR